MAETIRRHLRLVATEETAFHTDDVEASPLQHGGGGGTSGFMETVDAKIAAAEARVDTKFAELRGDLGKLPTTTTLVATAIAIIGIILGALAYGGDRLAMGIGLADKRQEQMKRDDAQDKSVSEMNGKLDLLLAGQKIKPANQ